MLCNEFFLENYLLFFKFRWDCAILVWSESIIPLSIVWNMRSRSFLGKFELEHAHSYLTWFWIPNSNASCLFLKNSAWPKIIFSLSSTNRKHKMVKHPSFNWSSHHIIKFFPKSQKLKPIYFSIILLFHNYHINGSIDFFSQFFRLTQFSLASAVHLTVLSHSDLLPKIIRCLLTKRYIQTNIKFTYVYFTI